jgi:predicted transcriptional regulator
MARKKTTIYLEPDLLNATKALAASSGRREYEVVEDALRAYMRSAEAGQARQELKDLLDRVAERSTLTDEEAMAIAYDELHAARAGQ